MWKFWESDEEYTFYTIDEEVEVLPAFSMTNNAIVFDLSLDTILHTRQVYNILDLLGDVGGLYGIL